MNLIRKLFLKLMGRGRTKCCESSANKDNDDPANVLYETFEHGFRYEEEKGFGICQMKHRNEL